MDDGHSSGRASANFNASAKKKSPEPLIPSRQQSAINKPALGPGKIEDVARNYSKVRRRGLKSHARFPFIRFAKIANDSSASCRNGLLTCTRRK